MTELDQFLQKTTESKEPIDVLPMCRVHIHEFHKTMDEVLHYELPYQVFHKGYLDLRAIGFHINGETGIPYMDNYEYDHVIFTQQRPSPKFPELLYTLKTLLAIILSSDCTGCCDALEFINVSRYGIYATGDVSRTYHS